MAPPSSFVYKQISRCRDREFRHSFTVAGIAEASPDDVFAFFLAVQTHPEVYDIVQEVTDVEVIEKGEQGQQVSETNFRMATRQKIMGRSFRTSMRMLMVADHSERKAKVELVKQNAMVKKMENTVTLLPLRGDLQDDKDQVTKAVEWFLAGMDKPQPDKPWLDVGEATCSPHRTIIILHQKIKPHFEPPLFGSFVRGHILHSAERDLLALLGKYQSAAAATAVPTLASHAVPPVLEGEEEEEEEGKGEKVAEEAGRGQQSSVAATAAA